MHKKIFIKPFDIDKKLKWDKNLHVIDKSKWDKTRPALCSHLPQSRIASQVAPQNHITPDIVLAHITLRSSRDSRCDEDESTQ